MPTSSIRPPRLAAWLARLCLDEATAAVVLGDLEETYHALHRRYGVASARRWYWSQVLRSTPSFIARTFYWKTAMLTNYLKIALRNLRKHKGYAVINVVGLAVGLAFCALIFLFVRDELTFDRFHEQGDRVYRVQTIWYERDGSATRGANHSIPLGPTLQQEVPEIDAYTRFKRLSHYVRSTGEAVEAPVLYADPSIFEIFSFPLAQGDPATALADRNAVVLTEHAARTYFGDDDPMGQTLQIRVEETFEDFVVTGVARDVPANSTIQFDILLHVDKVITTRYRDYLDSWSLVTFQTYVRLAERAARETAQAKLPAFFARHHGELLDDLRAREGWGEDDTPASYGLQPLYDVHLESESDPTYSYILGGIALAILLIACINFMTLSIGRSANRSKEIGVRKVVGAQRRQLMGQFWGEALVMSGLGLLLGIVLAERFLPLFNHLADKNLQFNYAQDWTTGAALTALVLLTGLVAGSYPALVLSSFKPIETLTNRLRLGGSNAFTKSLVVVQFALSLFLIISTLVMVRQLNYTRTKNLGFNKEQVVLLPLNGMDGGMLATRFRNALGSQARIEGLTATGNQLGRRGSSGYRYEHEGQMHTVNVFIVETNYLDFLGLDLVQGRNFDPNLATDTTEAVLVNEALVRDFGLDEPLGKPIPGLPGASPPVIVGVVKDYHFQALYQEIAPVMLTLNPAWGYDYLLVRTQPTDLPGTLALLGTTWQEVVPDIPFEYTFLDDDMQAQYAADRRWSRIVQYAALFAVLLACLGLFGLATLTVAGRTKEIGIRKVLGASASRIAHLIAKDFVRLVLVGATLAAPAAYVAMHRWLDTFAFRIELSWWIFLMAGSLALAIAVLAVSYQSIKAALADPVDSLRYE